jgi:hypothetical protein
LWINGVLVIDDWTNTANTQTNTSVAIPMTANSRYPITMEYYENTGAAVAKLLWKKPGTSSYTAIPASRLYAD